jgi:hypothetical protein
MEIGVLCLCVIIAQLLTVFGFLPFDSKLCFDQLLWIRIAHGGCLNERGDMHAIPVSLSPLDPYRYHERRIPVSRHHALFLFSQPSDLLLMLGIGIAS